MTNRARLEVLREMHARHVRDPDCTGCFLLSELARVEADAKGMEGTVVGLQHHVAAVCHERDAALARLKEVEAERDANRLEIGRCEDVMVQWKLHRDAAMARAEKAEDALKVALGTAEWARGSEALAALAQVQRLREAEASGRNVIIKALAAIVRLGLPDHVKVRGHGDRELIDREMVVQEVSRIRDAVDSLATPEPALTKQQATEAAALRTLTHEAPPDAPGVDPDFATEPKP